jgi:prophage antirepressor-like protein
MPSENNPEVQYELFEDKKVRTLWDSEKEEWYFSVIDVIAILTDSENPRRYWSDLKRKLNAEGSQLYADIVQLKMRAPDGKLRLTDCLTTEQLFRLIQSIPSPKAEPFKLWIAHVAKERLDQMEDPELSIQQALLDYKKLGYSENWINQRLKSIEIRKDLTDEWKNHGLKEGVQFATLTDIIYKTWAGKTAKEYKEFKGLKKENLRDNMTNQELVLNMLAELSTTDISKARNPQTFDDHIDVACRGGNIAKEAREKLELETGKKIVSPLNAKSFFEKQIEQDENEDIKDQETKPLK